MRKNVLNLSRFCMRTMLCQHEIEKKLSVKCFSSQCCCRPFTISNDDRNFLKIQSKTSRPYTETKVNNCWNCNSAMDINAGGTKESFFCTNCGSLQEVDVNYNYFSLFGIAEQFQINQNELTNKFRQYQSVLHPDKFSNKNETEQNLSAAVSSLVNKAYNTLCTPIKRAEYILELKGVTIPEANNVVDKAFLFEIMERNEEVEDANSPVDLKNLLLRVNEDKGKTFSDFDLHLKKNDLIAAKSSLILLRYYTSLETSIKNKLSQLGVVD